MEDVQSRGDDRGIPIQRAGVRDLRYPITVLDRREGKQQTVAVVTASASVPATEKGTHMSRFIEVLNDHVGELTINTIPSVLRDMRDRLGAEQADLEVRFTYFLARSAPATGATGLMDYDCWFRGSEDRTGDSFVLGVRTPVTSLCPCSKEISDYGAHNQRGFITIEVESSRDEDGQPALIWIEELIEWAEQAGSCPVYPVLKRPDERHVTMQAYDNPVFVEDMVRSVAVRLEGDPRVAWFRVEAHNQESIHNHDAFAEVRSS
jgi:GTP cyclohydrolase IB